MRYLIAPSVASVDAPTVETHPNSYSTRDHIVSSHSVRSIKDHTWCGRSLMSPVSDRLCALITVVYGVSIVTDSTSMGLVRDDVGKIKLSMSIKYSDCNQ